MSLGVVRWATWLVAVVRGRVLGLLVALSGLLGLWAVVFAGSAVAAGPCGSSGVFSQSGTTVTCTYTSAGTEDTFAVPAGISTVSVTAFGAQGGGSFGGAGGLGAEVVNTALPVNAGSTLWVDVGQDGASHVGGDCNAGQAGGLFDGGAATGCSGAGGGSSALLTAPRASAQLTGDPATDQRLLVAGGGGGAGGAAPPGGGGSAGDAAVTGAGNGSCGAAGAPGGIGPTDGTDGGGSGCGTIFVGGSGSASSGGGGGFASGGGGGGWFGGGGGGLSSSTEGGGGGGSSYGGAGPSGGITVATASSADAPEVMISYTLATTSTSVSAPASGTVGMAIAASSISATLSGATSVASGTITFTVFGPQSSPPTVCTSGGTTVGTATVSGNGTYHPSAGFTPPSAGTYWWYASYSGDGANQPSNSGCGTGMASTVVSTPAPAKPPTVPAAPKPLKLLVSPHSTVAGQHACYRFTATSGGHGVSGVRIRFTGHTVHTSSHGKARICETLRRRGTYTAHASKSGYRSATARVAVKVRPKPKPRPKPVFTG